MDRCTELCTKDATGSCALCEALAERDRFERRWFQKAVFCRGFHVLRQWWYFAPHEEIRHKDVVRESHKQYAETLNKTMLALLGIALFCLLTTIGSPDRLLLATESTIKVPFANSEMSFVGFIVVAPFLLIVLLLYLHIYYGYWIACERERQSINQQLRPPIEGIPTLFALPAVAPRVLTGFIFYWLVPVVLGVITWKAWAFPAMGRPLTYVFGVVTVVVVCLQLRRSSDQSPEWTRLYYLPLILVISLMVLVTFNPQSFQRPLALSRVKLPDAWLAGMDMRGASLGFANLQGAYLWASNLQRADLQQAQLQKADLREADLREADFLRAKLQGADLGGAKLQGAFLRIADLQGAKLQNANLQIANLQLADLQNADLQNVDLQNADLQFANLQFANLQFAEIQKANLQNANLQNANLQNANLQNANLQNANLQNANLQNANLQEAELQEAELQKAKLQKAKLQKANLQKANLQNANLQNANLQNANLQNVNLQEADLQEAEIQKANLQKANLQNANLQNANLQNATQPPVCQPPERQLPGGRDSRTPTSSMPTSRTPTSGTPTSWRPTSHIQKILRLARSIQPVLTKTQNFQLI